MKNFIRFTLNFVCILSSLATLHAQTMESLSGSERAITKATLFEWPSNAFPARGSALRSLSGTDTAISYFDATLPGYDWIAGAAYNPLIVPMFGERITLGQSNGYVDSISVLIDSTTADTIKVGLFPVTTAPNGFLVIDPNSQSPYAQGFILGSTIHGPTSVIVQFPHAEVPQDFAIGISPNIDYVHSVYKAVYLRGDLEPARILTVENTHSVFIGVYNGTVYSDAMDSIFTPPGHTSPAYTNLAVTAFISYQSATVEAEATPKFALFPNPASSLLQFSGTLASGGTRIELADVMGRQVLSSQLSPDGKLDIRALAPGRYQAIVRSAGGNFTAPVIIER